MSIPAPKILLMGAGGTGKTYALRTFINEGITPFVIALDAQGVEVLGDLPVDKCHWHAIKAPSQNWKTVIATAKNDLALNYEGLTKKQDFEKTKQNRWIEVLETMANFTCDRDGKSYGEIDSWGTDRAIVIDHNTELGMASKEWAVGNKMVMHQGEYLVAQNNVENLLRQLTIVCRCWVVVIAHIDRELDELRGGTKIMVHALGRRLAPKLPILFSDVVLAAREGKEFRWSTAEVDTDLKTRNLPIEAKLAPSFGPVVATWKKRGGTIESTSPK